jgi:hypothetical protein
LVLAACRITPRSTRFIPTSNSPVTGNDAQFVVVLQVAHGISAAEKIIERRSLVAEMLIDAGLLRQHLDDDAEAFTHGIERLVASNLEIFLREKMT